MLGTLPGPQGLVLESIREQLKDEACVKEFPKLRPGARGWMPRYSADASIMKSRTYREAWQNE